MKTIITAILSLLLLLGVAALMAWLLPVRAALFIVIVLQMLMLAAMGNSLPNHKDHRKDHDKEA